MKKLSLLLVLSILFSSCGHKFSLQKRRYQKGFYFAAQNCKQHSEDAQHQKTLRLEKRRTSTQTKVSVPTNDNLSGDTLGNVLQVNKNSNETTSGGLMTEQFQKSENPIKVDHPMQGLKEEAVKQNKHKQNFVRKLNRKDGRDFLATAYVGYIIVVLIALFISSMATIGLVDTLIIIGLSILAILVFYIIGKLFMSLFGR